MNTTDDTRSPLERWEQKQADHTAELAQRREDFKASSAVRVFCSPLDPAEVKKNFWTCFRNRCSNDATMSALFEGVGPDWPHKFCSYQHLADTLVRLTKHLE